jgi:hypothetical protein
MTESLFLLKPVIKHPLHVFFIVDNSYVYDETAKVDLEKQLRVLDQHVFHSDYRDVISIQWFYFKDHTVNTSSNQKNKSMSSILEVSGLPQFGEALTQALSSLDAVIQSGNPLKPWFFILHHGFSVGPPSWDKLSKILAEKKVFFRGFIISQSIKITAIQDAIMPLPYVRVKSGRLTDMFTFIFKLAQDRVQTPEAENVKLPGKEAIALWSEVLSK